MSDAIVLWYRDDCSKCRRARALLEEADAPFRLRAFVDEPPAAAELEALLVQLGGERAQIARDLPEGVDAATASDAELGALLAAAPASIQRPIAVRRGRALIARPPERVLELLDGR